MNQAAVERQPITEEELSEWARLNPDHVYGGVIVRLVVEVRWLRSRIAYFEAQHERDTDDARDLRWGEVQDVAARLLAGMLSRSDLDGSTRVYVGNAVDVAEALVAEVARRREVETGDGG